MFMMLEITHQIGNIMRNFLYLFFGLVLIFSCTTEEEEFLYKASIANQSTSNLNVKGYDSQNSIAIDLNIVSLTSGGETSYTAPVFLGYINNADSLVFTFSNGRGYICDVRQSVNNFCFLNTFPFDASGFNEVSTRVYEFEITQQDFDNAFDLP